MLEKNLNIVNLVDVHPMDKELKAIEMTPSGNFFELKQITKGGVAIIEHIYGWDEYTKGPRKGETNFNKQTIYKVPPSYLKPSRLVTLKRCRLYKFTDGDKVVRAYKICDDVTFYHPDMAFGAFQPENDVWKCMFFPPFHDGVIIEDVTDTESDDFNEKLKEYNESKEGKK